ncbi:schwannomin-interacting protein 1-like [Chiloscyllium punctatum]|uniref:schwannomin-interacting protein 1-like n=1 Tax=Chiloscyllium punctatum TaxID=137246 RepID=UPI003B63C9CA
MDSGGELFSSLTARPDSGRFRLSGQKPPVGLGSSSSDDEGFQDCELRTPEGQAQDGPVGLAVGEGSSASPTGSLSSWGLRAAPAGPPPPAEGTSPSEAAASELPILNWETLESHIAGLQLQEDERQQARERNRKTGIAAREGSPRGRRRMERFSSWERASNSNWQMTNFHCTTRFHSRMNLQLCFINDSSSESEAEETVGGASSTPSPQPTTGESSPTEGSLESRRKELESEAKRSLALLQRRLDQEKQLLRAAAERRKDAEGRGKSVERSDLQTMKLPQIWNLQSHLYSQIHGLNTQLMELLETRDELKTKQDALLVEIGDLTH